MSTILTASVASAQVPTPVSPTSTPPPPAPPQVQPVPQVPVEPASPVPSPWPVPTPVPPVPFDAFSFDLLNLQDRMSELREKVAESEIALLSQQTAEQAARQAEVVKQWNSHITHTTATGYNLQGGLNLIQQRQYERAIAAFDLVIGAKQPRADAALYWKGFAQFKLGRSDDALATIAQLRRDYPQSPYLTDAKVLETDVRRLAGQPVNPESLQDDEIKLLAIQGIGRSEQAIPLLEGVLNATNTLAVKKRAIYVLALSEDPRARQILLRYAKGGGNPDLQIEAIRYLASRKDSPTAGQDLREIYEATTDPAVRMTIVDSIAAGSSRNAELADTLVALARKETNMTVKTQIVRRLSEMAPRSKAAADYLSEVLKAR
jgi:tetratricopeptide (TPR) repeat protein